MLMDSVVYIVLLFCTRAVLLQTITQREACSDNTSRETQQQLADTVSILRQYAMEIDALRKKVESCGKNFVFRKFEEKTGAKGFNVY